MKCRHCSTLFKLLLLYFTLTSVLLHPTDAQQPSNSSSTSNDGNYALQRSKVSPLMLVILIVLVLGFTIVGCSAIFICSGNSPIGAPLPISGIAQPITDVQRGLDQSVLDTCPIFLYSAVKELKIGKGTLECAVCLNEFQDDETLRLLPVCDHVFHSECVDTWLSGYTTCPVCRACLVPESTSVDSGSSRSDDLSEGTELEITVTVAPVSSSPIRVPKSHSTGHSLVPTARTSEDRERFTLRLPNEVRKQLLVARPGLNRTTSTVVLPRVSSSRRGYRCGGEGGGSSRYGRFFGRSFRWNMKNNGCDEDASRGSKRVFGTVVMPLEALP